MNNILWTEYAAQDAKRREAEEALKSAKAIMEELEPSLLEDMAASGVDRFTVNGVTFYINRRLYAGPDEGFDRQMVAAALKESGLEDYAKLDYNANSLASYVRSIAKESDVELSTEELRAKLPEPLRAVLKVGEVFSIGSRKS